MTRAFDNRARDVLSLFDGGLTGDEHPRDLRVEMVPKAFARPYIARGHYSHTFPDSTLEAFAGFYGDICAGIVLFGMGANHAAFTALIPDIAKGEYRELTRLWVDDAAPHNTASRLVSRALSQLPPNVCLIVSFADTAQGHIGYIYQATNFHYCGISKGSSGLVDEHGASVHPRLLGIYRMRQPHRFGEMSGPEIAATLGWSFTKGSDKHRYALGRGIRKRHVNRLLPSLPFPKGRRPVSGSRRATHARKSTGTPAVQEGPTGPDELPDGLGVAVSNRQRELAVLETFAAHDSHDQHLVGPPDADAPLDRAAVVDLRGEVHQHGPVHESDPSASTDLDTPSDRKE